MINSDNSIMDSNWPMPAHSKQGLNGFFHLSLIALAAVGFAGLLFSAHEGFEYRLAHTAQNNVKSSALTASLQPQAKSSLQSVSLGEPHISLSLLTAKEDQAPITDTLQVSYRPKTRDAVFVEHQIDNGDEGETQVKPVTKASSVRVSAPQVFHDSRYAQLEARKVSNPVSNPVIKEKPASYRATRDALRYDMAARWQIPQQASSQVLANTYAVDETTRDKPGVTTYTSDRPAETLYSPKPKYPNSAVRKRLEAEVHVSFIVNTAGDVENVTFSQPTNKHFARSITRTLKEWRFTPAMVNGKQVNSIVTETFSFTQPEKRLLYITGTRFPKVLKEAYLPKDFAT